MMPPFESNETQTHSKYASKYGLYRNEKQSEGNKMEVDSMVAPKPQPTKLILISIFGILTNTIDGFGEIKGVTLNCVPMFAKATTHSNEIANLTISNMIAKEKWENPMVKIDMEWRISILAQLEPIAAFVAIAPNLDVTKINLGVYVKVEEIEAANTKE